MQRYLEMNNSQVGEGDRGVISRIMTRLTIAKIFQLIGKDVSYFRYYIPPNDDVYYSYDDKIADLLEFLDGINADYDWSDEVLTIHHSSDINGLYNLEEAVEYQWLACEYEELELDEDESLVSLTGNSIKIILRDYGGIPIQIIREYYELLKGHDLL